MEFLLYTRIKDKAYNCLLYYLENLHQLYTYPGITMTHIASTFVACERWNEVPVRQVNETRQALSENG